MTPATAPAYTCEIPLDFNGYVAVAKRVERVPASEIITGDVLILDGYVSRVGQVCVFDLINGKGVGNNSMSVSARLGYLLRTGGWPVLYIAGDINIIRFPQEIVSVIRTER